MGSSFALHNKRPAFCYPGRVPCRWRQVFFGRELKQQSSTQQQSMPLYEYVCHKCHKKFGEVLTIKEHETKKLHCPKCQSTDLEKVIEPFFAKTASKTGHW